MSNRLGRTVDGLQGEKLLTKFNRVSSSMVVAHFPCSADHEQDWQPHPVDPYSCYMCDYTCQYTLVKGKVKSLVELM